MLRIMNDATGGTEDRGKCGGAQKKNDGREADNSLHKNVSNLWGTTEKFQR
jgi:hypothetical protein